MSNLKPIFLSVLISITLIVLSLFIYKTFFAVQIRYIRTGELVEKYAGMKDAKALYKKKLDAWQANIDTLEYDYQLTQTKYESQKATLSAAAKAEQQALLQKQIATINAFVEKTEQKAKEEDGKMTETVLNQINQFIEDYSKRKAYDVVLGTNASGTLLYGEKTLDITEEITTELNNYYLDKK